MKKRRILLELLGILFLSLACCMEIQADEIGPRWQIGDRWSIETQGLQSQSSYKSHRTSQVEWRFEVVSVEKAVETECYRVEVTCADTSRLQPSVTLWVSQKTGMLMRITSRIPVEGKYREYTESYVMSEGVPTPVLGILPALPLDFPILSAASRNSKSLKPMIYEAISENGRTKDLNEMRFAYPVIQTVTAVPANRMKSLDGLGSTEKSVQVRLEVGSRKVEQVWVSHKPWPVYSTNGLSVSRLKHFEPAKKNEVK